jgi:hypothetical protein
MAPADQLTAVSESLSGHRMPADGHAFFVRAHGVSAG